MTNRYDAHEKKRNCLGQYDKKNMIKVNEIAISDNQHCKEIIYEICELASAIKKTKTQIAHRMKNRDIVVNFKSRTINNL